MRTLLSLFALCFSAFGAVTVSPSSISQSMRGAVADYPRTATVYPAKKFITITGTGDWTVTRGGYLSTACNYGAGCFTALPASGNGNGTVTINWTGQGAEILADGVHTGTVTVTGNAAITITLTVVTPLAYATFSYAQGYPQGCTNSDSLFSFADTCTIANERPPSEAFSIPAQGASYVDPEFGRTVTRITKEGEVLTYSTLTAFTVADPPLVFTDNGDTTYNLSNLSGTVIYSGLTRGDTTFTALDALDSDIYWRRSADHELWEYKISTATDTKAADYHSTYTSISNGGSADISDDNWWAFFAPTEMLVCAVNLNGLTTANQATHTYCASYAGLLGGDGAHVDFVQVSMIDGTSSKRYVIMLRATAAAVWSVNTSTGVLDWERYLGEEPQRYANDDDGVCESGETCIAEPHSTIGRDALGNVIFFFDWAEIYGNQTYLVTLQLNKTMIFRPVEEGGGMRFLFATSCVGCDRHLSCNGAGYCSMSGFKSSIPAKAVTGATRNKPAEITTSTAHGWATGTKVEIDQVVGNTCVNHVWTITSTGSYTFTLDGSDCTGSGTYAGGGLAGLGTAATNYPLRDRNIVIYLNGAGSVAYPINHHRGKIWSTGGYWETSMTNLSRNGAYIAYATNMGNIGGSGQTSTEMAVYIAATGLGGAGAPANTKITGPISITGGVKIQ